jgi:uncharacterized membrane protein YhiD involved in acid resistance
MALQTNPLQADATLDLFSYSLQEMVVNAAVATLLGLLVSTVYRVTHKGLSYSQSFTQTLVWVSLIVSIVMMVIGASLARAFALVGALSIIRFRTVVKDTKDTSFVFASLALGMASGTGNYALAGVAVVFVVIVAVALHATNFGALQKSEFVLRFLFDQSQDNAPYLEVLKSSARRAALLNLEPSGDGAFLRLTYDVQLQHDVAPEAFTQELSKQPGVSEVVLIVSKNDVDY